MVRIVGVNLPDNKRLEYALTLIYGIGFTRSRSILDKAGIKLDKRVKEVTEEEVKKIQDAIEHTFKVEGELKSEVSDNIKRLREIGTYRGFRHLRGLPVRGQRTRSNARTRRGSKRRTIGSLTKEAWAKQDQLAQKKPAGK